MEVGIQQGLCASCAQELSILEPNKRITHKSARCLTRGSAWCIWAVGWPQTYSVYAVKTAEDEIDKAVAEAETKIINATSQDEVNKAINNAQNSMKNCLGPDADFEHTTPRGSDWQSFFTNEVQTCKEEEDNEKILIL